MKFQGLFEAGLLASTVLAFSNSGPAYFHNANRNNDLVLSHFMKSEELVDQIEQLNEKVVIYQLDKNLLSELRKNEEFVKFMEDSKFSKKVIYDNDNNKLPFGKSSIEDADKLEIKSNIVLESTDSIKQFLGSLRQSYSSNSNVLVQFIPIDSNHNDHDSETSTYKITKNDEYSEEYGEESLDDLSETFDRLIEQAKNEGGFVTIQEDEDVENKEDENYDNEEYEPIKVQGGSLFETYQFFSSGILSATIISLFLVFVLIQGLNFLQSLQISYRALEKPLDVSKKIK